MDMDMVRIRGNETGLLTINQIRYPIYRRAEGNKKVEIRSIKTIVLMEKGPIPLNMDI